MCFTVSINASARTIATRFSALVRGILLDGPGVVSGFSHPQLAVLTPERIESMNWGLVPHWVKSQEQALDLRKKTLNARSETIHQLPSFRDAKPAIIPVNSFFEWQHHDDGSKTKFELLPAESDLFMLGGLWAEWISPQSGTPLRSFTIVTVPANPLMAEIHNTKKRMPLIIPEGLIDQWFARQYEMVGFPQELMHAKKR